MKIFLKRLVVAALLIVVIKSEMENVTSDYYKNVTEIMVNFFAKEIRPVKLTAFLCWDYPTTKHLTKTLMQNSIQVSTLNIKNVNNVTSTIIKEKEYHFYLLDTCCYNFHNILLKAGESKLFNFPYRWLLLQNCSGENLQFKRYYFPVSSRIYVMKYCAEKTVITSIYQTMYQEQLLFNDVATWVNNNFVAPVVKIEDFNHRRNLHKMQFNTSILYTNNKTLENFVLKKSEDDTMSKQSTILLYHAWDMLNVTPNLIIRNTWGYKDPKTNIHNGMFGDMQSSLCEYGAVSGFITNDRLEFVEYIGNVMTTGGVFVFMKPPLTAMANIYTLPFTTKLWYSIYLLLAIIFQCIYIIIKWEAKQPKNLFYNEVKQLRPNISDIVQFEIGAVCQQGSEAEPRSGAGKIASFIIFLSLMFMYTSYSANIVTLLQSTSKSIRNLEDLLNSGITLGAENITYSNLVFGPSKGGVYNEIAAKIEYYDVPDGVNRIRTDFFAYHAEGTTIYYQISKTYQEQEKCGLNYFVYWNDRPYLAARKTSDYKGLLRVVYAKLYENGFRRRNMKIFYSYKPLCSHHSVNFVSVSIYDCYFASMCFFIGVVLSAVILCVEAMFKKWKSRTN